MRAISVALLILVLASPCAAQGALLGSFRFLGTVEGNPLILIYPGEWDTWAFDVENVGLPSVEAFEFHFQGDFFQGFGDAFRQTATAPVTFGFSVHDTFFVTRPSIANADVLISPGTLIDTPTEFKVAYTAAGAPSLLDTGEKRAVMYFSVPVGEKLDWQNFVDGKGAVAGPLQYIPITFVPEPAGLLLMGMAGLGLAVGTVRLRLLQIDSPCNRKRA